MTIEPTRRRLKAGWTFVVPDAHPSWPTDTLESTINRGGLALMQIESEKVEAEYARLRKASADLVPGGF